MTITIPAPRLDLTVPTGPDLANVGDWPRPAPTRSGAELQSPPPAGLPPWASEPPLRDAAQQGLFPAEIERAGAFWDWLRETRTTCVRRAHNGYAYLSIQTRIDAADLALYHNLLHWVAWCDACYWLLTAWYAPHHGAPQPRLLVLPFIGLSGRQPAAVVRELTGFPGQWLLEDALEDWHALALATGYLLPLDDATPPAEAPATTTREDRA